MFVVFSKIGGIVFLEEVKRFGQNALKVIEHKILRYQQFENVVTLENFLARYFKMYRNKNLQNLENLYKFSEIKISKKL